MRRAGGRARSNQRRDAEGCDARGERRRGLVERGVAATIRRGGTIGAKGKPDPPGLAIDQPRMDAQQAKVALQAAFQDQRAVFIEPGEECGADRAVQWRRGRAIAAGVMYSEGGSRVSRADLCQRSVALPRHIILQRNILRWGATSKEILITKYIKGENFILYNETRIYSS